MQPTQTTIQSSSPTDTQTQVQPEESNNKLFTIVTIVGCILILLGSGLYAGYKFAYQNNQTSPTTKTTITPSLTQAITQSPTTIQNQYIGWTTYTNTASGYSFKYPSDWKIDTSLAQPTPTTDPSTQTTYKTTEVKVTSPEGYIFKFDYDLFGVGTSAIHYTKTVNVTIDGMPLKKIYFDSCDYTPGVSPSIVSTDPCLTKISGIGYNTTVTSTNNTSAYLFTLHNKATSIALLPPINKIPVSITDPTFEGIDKKLDLIIASFVLPTT